MKNITWIVEKYMFSEYEDRLVESIKNSGANCFLFDDTHYSFDFDKSIKDKFKDDIVIFYGSLQRGRQILSLTNHVPGIFLTIDNYECYKYYGYYGDHMVNSDYLFMGLNDVKRNKEKIFDLFNTESIFIRPSNGYKTFTGQLLPKENFDFELIVLCKSYGGVDLDQLVLVAPCQKIVEENRYIVINKNGVNQIIDGNTYMINGELVSERLVDNQAFEYAESVVNLYTADKAFTIDIAKMEDGSYKVLEIGSFCCASWYNALYDKVVNNINELVINEYIEYWS